MDVMRIDRIINILYSTSAASVLLGAFFRLQHYPFGYVLLFGGFILGSLTSNIHVNRLKKRIKNLEERKFVD